MTTRRPGEHGPPARSALAACLAAVVQLVGAGCADLPSERAERDLEVGRVDVGGVHLQVRDGLAAVRHAAPGELVLWASAPTVELEAVAAAGATTRWIVEIRNAVPEAALTGWSDDGTLIPVLTLPSVSVTQPRFEVDLAQVGTTHLRLARPGAAEAVTYAFAVVSDVQNGIDAVGDVFAAIAAEPPIEFVLSAGDLTQNGTVEEMDRFQQELGALPVPLYATIGNHDAPPDTPWHERFGRGSFHFRHRGVTFSLLDSASGTVAPLAYDWLSGWLAEGAAGVHVFVTHVPPIDPVGARNGSFGSRGEAGKLLAMLVRGRVDVTLYGHLHSYYAFENAGIPAFISGGGGAFEEKLDGIGRHFLYVVVDPSQGIRSVRVVRVDD